MLHSCNLLVIVDFISLCILVSTFNMNNNHEFDVTMSLAIFLFEMFSLLTSSTARNRPKTQRRSFICHKDQKRSNEDETEKKSSSRRLFFVPGNVRKGICDSGEETKRRIRGLTLTLRIAEVA